MARLLRLLLGVLAAFVAFVVVMRLLFPLPGLEGRIASTYLPTTPETTLGAFVRGQANSNGEMSGMYPLFHGAEAFAARVELARMAEESIDARYYIWQRDLTGIALLDELRQAAERGVRVRLLVDDNGTPDLDVNLAALNAMENAEVRIFNPFTLRSPRLLSYGVDFPRLNRRMHNKSFTVDGSATIVGGRNVGDIYFSRASDSQYSDFDLLLVGQAADEVGADFDRYWNSGSAYPHELLVTPEESGMAQFASDVVLMAQDPGWEEYRASIAQSPLGRYVETGTLPLEWVSVTLFSDDPAKGLGRLPDDQLLIHKLARVIEDAQVSIDIISAYFIPGDIGSAALTSAVARGLHVRTLTNSLEATDVIPVHAGYSRYRDDLIDGGVEVFELRPDQSPTNADELGIIGSSAASLHAKSVALDGARVFVGSFNFDPRSAFLNCEMGFLVESATLASRINEAFAKNLSGFAWRVTRAPDGGLQWQAQDVAGAMTTLTDEPGASLGVRFALKVVALLPVQWML